jgi:restriction endonuclease S subunit
MSSYTLNNTALDKKKVFILQKSEIEKRFDPEYYGHSFNHYDKILAKKTYKRFSQILKTINNGFDFRDYKESGTPYIKVANIRKGAFRFDKMQYIEFDSSEISKNIQLKKGNILLTRKGTFGYAISLDNDYDYVISSEVFYIEINQDLINSKYLEIFFNSKIGQAQFDKNKIGAIMGSLSQEAIKELKIPIPSIEIQNKIIEVYSNYIIQKQQNEAEVGKLLASIDTYLLKELGITLPIQEENTLKSRMFLKTFKDISGRRYDPNYFSNEFKILDNLFKKLKPIKLGEISVQISDAPHERPEFSENEDIRVIMIEHLKPEGIQKTKEKYITEKYHLKLKSTILEKDDLLIARIGVTTGVTSIVDDFFVGKNISGNITLIRLNHSKICANFVLEYLNSYLGRLYSKRILSNSARDFLTVGKIKSIEIPILPIEKQKEIANHITAIRQEAQTLKDKTKLALKKSNEEIENLLLN